VASRTIDIREDQDGKKRVLSHTFYGKDAKEAKHIQRSHQKADRFLDAAVKGKEFKGIPLEARVRRKPMDRHRRGGRRGARRGRRGY